MRTPWSGIWTWLDVTRQLCSVAFMGVTPYGRWGSDLPSLIRGVRGGLESKGLPCDLNETRQLRRLEAYCTSAHVQFHPLGEYEAPPGATLCENCWDARWRLERPIELGRDLGQWHAVFLQLADVHES